ncbi:MAG: type II toxin-antitoxin system HicB family antitoxin [Zoogloeaceae bacterium]|jgi:predicted HicB family RNase H-like nuclease|nr:type II toxin-antitoxin system HicB family antitoxin [Zoogloeaceae bacterium]
MNTMTINDYQAVISFDPDIQIFRGEFVGLNGGADFYASDVEGLRREGEISLKVFLDACTEDGVEPRKHFSGKFSLRVEPAIHEAAVIAARARAEPQSMGCGCAQAGGAGGVRIYPQAHALRVRREGQYAIKKNNGAY